MARKKGTKNTDRDLKDLMTLEKSLEPGKTKAELAKELGINPNTVTVRLQRAISNINIQDFIQRSIDRNAQMLEKCDKTVNQVLDCTDNNQFGNKIRVVEGIYKTFGVWKADPILEVNNFTPIVFKIGDEVMSIDVGASQKTGPGSSQQE